MRLFRTVASVCSVFGVVLGLSLSAFAVELRYEDVDADGVLDIVLANEFLSVEVTTGEKPAPPVVVEKKLLDGVPVLKRVPLLNRMPPVGQMPLVKRFRKPPKPQKKPRERYRTRFVWAGWINNLTFKPTNRRWFVNDSKRHWHGIPEEFEEAVKMKQHENGEWDVIKIGVGVCRGRGMCGSGGLKLQTPVAWEHVVRDTPKGGKSLLFRHELDAGHGYGYAFEKEFILEPNESRLVVRRSLRNTGSETFRTTWYTHAFWGQATDGNGYDADSWTTIPISYGGDGPLAGLVDTHACYPLNTSTGGIWGPVAADRIAESWYASGNRKTRDILVAEVEGTWAWDRIWTYSSTYSCEPFLAIELKPGETRNWTVTRHVGNGLTGVRGVGSGGIVDWRLEAAESAPGTSELQLQFIPDRPREHIQLALTVTPRGNAGPPKRMSTTAGAHSPMQPLTETFDLGQLTGPCEVRAVVRDGSAVLADVTRLCGTADMVPSPELGANGGSALGLILTDSETNKETGEQKMPQAAGFLKDYLIRAGFGVQVANPARMSAAPPSWGGARVVMVTQLGRVPGFLRGWLEEHVSCGGGLVVCGPMSLGTFEFSELLPVTRMPTLVTLKATCPRDGTREFIGLSGQRYHLVGAEAHPITSGLPLYPQVYQDIARAQVLDPRQGATIVLNYASGPDVEPQLSGPALVVSTYGKGRVAVFASPVDWGLPDRWVVYSRLAEYHRKLFAQTALWAAGLMQ